MKINIYNENLERIAIIGNRFVSCLWSEGYNTTQNFTLELQDAEDYRDKIKTDFYVGREDRKTLMVIKAINIKDGKIVLSGKQATRVLKDVAFIGTITENSVIDKTIEREYNLSNKFPNVEIASSDIGVKYKNQISHKSFLELCETMCSSSDLGFRSVREGRKIVVEFYKPDKNEELIYKSSFGNLKLNEITHSTEPLKNYAIVLGEGEGEDRKTVEIDLTNGETRRELIVDARDITSKDGESDAEYQQRLKERGIEKLFECKQTFVCSITPNEDEFGYVYDLGDVLTILIPEYDFKFNARIVRFTQKSQNNTETTTIDVGEFTNIRR